MARGEDEMQVASRYVMDFAMQLAMDGVVVCLSSIGNGAYRQVK